jgi:hypothetical protein
MSEIRFLIASSHLQYSDLAFAAMVNVSHVSRKAEGLEARLWRAPRLAPRLEPRSPDLLHSG